MGSQSDSKWPQDAVGMKENTKLVIDEDGTPL